MTKRLFLFGITSFGLLLILGGTFLTVIGPALLDPQAQVAQAAQPDLSVLVEDTPRPTRTPRPTQSPFPTPTLAPSSTLFPTATTVQLSLPANYGPNYYPDDINPLTGLVVDPALLDRLPMAIKITNYPRRVRPLSGLTLADLVFEYYIETGLTRFIAVFYGNDAPEVGPIRSGRFFDEHVVRMYNAVFAFASADARVLGPWMNSDLSPILVIPRPYNCPPMCRDESKPDEYNNLFTNTEALQDYIAWRGVVQTRQELEGMRFQTIIPWGSKLGTEIFVRYSRVSFTKWVYNPVNGRYHRFKDIADDTGDGETYEAHFDKVTGEPVTADNVVILFLPHEEYLREGSTEIFKLHLVGSGKAIIFRDGKAYVGTWARTAEDQPLQLFRSGGAGGAFPLKPGRTFFQVMGVTSDTLTDNALWRFVFHIP